MKSLTESMLAERSMYGSPDYAFQQGALQLDRPLLRYARLLWADVRRAHGLAPIGSTPLLTKGKGNHKLGLATKFTVGLTLQHYVQKLTTGLTINACPNAGDCTKVCVLDQGRHAQDPRVKKARRAKTEFFARYPVMACFILGWELANVVDRHGRVLFRPNVNSDVEWEKILPSLTSGRVFGDAVMSYGYTKLTEVLVTDGWLDAAYRVAYSWNERTPDVKDVMRFLEAGGSVAVVSARRKGEPVPDSHRFADTRGGYCVLHDRGVDADLTDEWIFEQGVIGDLSAKGTARSLIGKSGFIIGERTAA